MPTSRPDDSPFNLETDWRKWALGFAALWFIEIAMVEAGAGDLAVVLALGLAGTATALTVEAATKNLGLAARP